MIKAHFATGGTGADLLRVAQTLRLDPRTIDQIDETVASRKRNRARIPKL